MDAFIIEEAFSSSSIKEKGPCFGIISLHYERFFLILVKCHRMSFSDSIKLLFNGQFEAPYMRGSNLENVSLLQNCLTRALSHM